MKSKLGYCFLQVHLAYLKYVIYSEASIMWPY